jgi:hypothetical protein
MAVMDVAEITSVKGLQQWLRKHSVENREWFVRRAPDRSKCLFISDKPTMTFAWDFCTSEDLPLYSIQLPSIGDARDWWFKFWEDEIVECFYASGTEIACIAKSGTWKSLSPWGFARYKEDFELVDEAQFRQLVGEICFKEMLFEQRMVGISTRRIRSQE